MNEDVDEPVLNARGEAIDWDALTSDQRAQQAAFRAESQRLTAFIGAATEEQGELKARTEVMLRLTLQTLGALVVMIVAGFLLARSTLPARAYAWAAAGALRQSVAAMLVLVVGVGGYLFRKYERRAYGVAEINVGIVTAALALGQAVDAGAKTVTLLGAVYLIVRGLDNASIGLDEAKLSPTYKRVLALQALTLTAAEDAREAMRRYEAWEAALPTKAKPPSEP